jgi:hypothetical protein
MAYHESFEKIAAQVNGLDASKVEGHFAFQFNIISEEDAGIFYVEINDGKIIAMPYDYQDNDAVVSATSEEIIKYFNNESANYEVMGDKLDVLTAVVVNSANKKKPAAKKTATKKASTTKKAAKDAADEKPAKKTATKKTAAKKTTKKDEVKAK